ERYGCFGGVLPETPYSLSRWASGSSEWPGIRVSAALRLIRYRRAAFAPKISCLVALLAPPRAGEPYFFCMSSGISSRRMASICHCGDPYQTESVPPLICAAPIPLVNVPINAAENLGWATAELANDVPSSAYTLVTPNLCGISARSLAHLMRPVDSNSAQARSGNSRNGRSAE